MATVKLTSTDTNIGTAGVIDDIPIIAGSKKLGFDGDTRGGGVLPVVSAGQSKQQSFETPVSPTSTGVTWADCLAILRSLDNVTLAAGTNNGDSDFDATGPVTIEVSGDAVAVATITVG
jgi:hypothetical protein